MTDDDLSEQIVVFVRSFVTEHGYAPTVREICVGLPGAASRATIHRRLRALQEAGRISSQPLSARTIRVLDA